MDAYLSQLGLCRKTIVRDGSCLFRAVSEKLFLTQAYHLRIRRMCAEYLWRHRIEFEPFIEGSFEERIFRLQNSKEWAGQVEMMVLSRLYCVDFIIFQQPECPPANVTQNNFISKILLCFVDGVHYDIIYPRSYIQDAAVCQAIIYEILYQDVFQLTSELKEAVFFIRQQKKSNREILENGFPYLEPASGEKSLVTRHHTSRTTPPLPYRIAKALDPLFYRNVELDIIQEEKREAKLRSLQGKDSNGFAPGDKCQVLLPSHTDQLYNAHIQELSDNQGPVEVFIEELGEKKTVPYSSLKALPAGLKNNCLLSLEGKGKRKKGVMPVASVELQPQQHYHISPSRTTPPPQCRPSSWNSSNSRRPLDMGRRMPILQTQLAENCDTLENGGGQYCAGPQSPQPHNSSHLSVPLPQPPVYLVPVVNVPFVSSIGQVNFSWGPSQDPYGKDLPLSDMNTLRYFFNLGNEDDGVEYSRMVSTFQQSQQPSLPPPPPPPAMLGPTDIHGQPVLTSHYDQGQSDVKIKFHVKKPIGQIQSSDLDPSQKSFSKKGNNSESDCREKEADDEACLSSDSGCLSECSGSLSPSKLEGSGDDGDMEGRPCTGESEGVTVGSSECVEITATDGKGKGKRKYYMYGNYKLVKPIKEIPPRFQVMLAETSAAKARCEGQPIYIQQQEELYMLEKENGSSLNANANCFVPGGQGGLDVNSALSGGMTFLPCTSLQLPHSQHPALPTVAPSPSSSVLAPPCSQMYTVPPPSLPLPTSCPSHPPPTSQPLPNHACPPLTSPPNSYANGGGSCYYVYPSSPSTGFAHLPGTPTQAPGQVVYMMGPSYPAAAAPMPAFQTSLPPGSYSVGVPCPASAQ